MKKVLCAMALFLTTGYLQSANSTTSKPILGGENDTVTVTFKVNGTATCEASIEGALTSHSGVVSANWIASTKMMTIKYLTANLQASDLHSFLALAGYDTAELRAKNATYDALAQECKYTRDPETE